MVVVDVNQRILVLFVELSVSLGNTHKENYGHTYTRTLAHIHLECSCRIACHSVLQHDEKNPTIVPTTLVYAISFYFTKTTNRFGMGPWVEPKWQRQRQQQQRHCLKVVYWWILTTTTTTTIVRAGWILPSTIRRGSFVPTMNVISSCSSTCHFSASLDAYVERMQDESRNVTCLEEGRACPGEPSVDPSKVLQWNQGDSEWMEDW